MHFSPLTSHFYLTLIEHPLDLTEFVAHGAARIRNLLTPASVPPPIQQDHTGGDEEGESNGNQQHPTSQEAEHRQRGAIEGQKGNGYDGERAAHERRAAHTVLSHW